MRSVPPAEAPLGWRFVDAEEALETSNRSLQAAARAQRPLLILLGAAFAGNEAVSSLLEALRSDPMFGFAVARTATESGLLAKLRGDLGDPDIETLPRSALAALPRHYIVPEVVGTCFVVRAELVGNIGTLDSRFETTAGAWLHYLCRARRLGFRGVIVNRALIPIAGEITPATVSPYVDDFWRVHRQFPDTTYAQREFDRLPAHEYETFLGRARGTGEQKRKSMLLDARGMASHHNGTSECILGLMDGFAVAAPDWRISILLGAEANKFHKVSERHRDWEIFEQPPQSRFSIALRLNQPWHGSTLTELHQRALFNFYFMNDTIAWDILHNGASRQAVDATWRFIGQYADGLMFNSEFSRQRYDMRFQPSALVRQSVSYHPFHPADYVHRNGHSPQRGDYILVIGNHLDHKSVIPTVHLLSTAFPFEAIRVLGCGDLQLSNVTSVISGDRSEEEIMDLIIAARIVVFPSFYEGFGFPVLQGLACGKAVVARQSTLLEEIASRTRADGRLYAFSNPAELLGVVGRLLQGDDNGDLSLATALAEAESPLRWTDIARNMLEFMIASFEVSSPQWLRREQAIDLNHAWS